MVLWTDAKEEHCQGRGRARNRLSTPCDKSKGPEGQRSLSRDGSIAAGVLPLEATIWLGQRPIIQTPWRVFLTESSKPFHTDLYAYFDLLSEQWALRQEIADPQCKEFPNERRMSL